MLARELMTTHGLKQTEAAQRLGLSQPAISLYRRKIRGKALSLENDGDIKNLTGKLASRIAASKLSRKEYVLGVCEICKTIRGKGLLCELHRSIDPSIIPDKCDLCITMEQLSCV
jgi:predicted transcriptional regulator